MTLPHAGVFAFLVLVASQVSVGQAPAAVGPKDTLAFSAARQLLAAMHAEQGVTQGIDSSFAAQRRSGNNKLPPVFFDSLTARVRRLVPELVDSLATLYAAQLSVADLKDLLTFYQSPLGQRYSRAYVAVQQQSGEMARRWGIRVAVNLMKDLVDKGLITDLPH
jgi:uncharacterized protein